MLRVVERRPPMADHEARGPEGTLTAGLESIAERARREHVEEHLRTGPGVHDEGSLRTGLWGHDEGSLRTGLWGQDEGSLRTGLWVHHEDSLRKGPLTHRGGACLVRPQLG
jgi:hypothetical protein